MGGEIPAWFDMAEIPLQASVPDYGCSLDQASANVPLIHKLLDDMISSGIPSDKIIVGGFSQGATMAMLAAMQYPQQLAGVVNFAGPLLGADQLHGLVHPSNRCLQVLWCHGTIDKPMPPVLQDQG